MKGASFGVYCLCWKIYKSGESENEADANYAEKRSYLGDRAPTPFPQTSKSGLRKKDVLHFLTTASMSTNQTLPALGGGIERCIFWCILFILEIERKCENRIIGEQHFAHFHVVGCSKDVKDRNKWPAAIFHVVVIYLAILNSLSNYAFLQPCLFLRLLSRFENRILKFSNSKLI